MPRAHGPGAGKAVPGQRSGVSSPAAQRQEVATPGRGAPEIRTAVAATLSSEQHSGATQGSGWLWALPGLPRGQVQLPSSSPAPQVH